MPAPRRHAAPTRPNPAGCRAATGALATPGAALARVLALPLALGLCLGAGCAAAAEPSSAETVRDLLPETLGPGRSDGLKIPLGSLTLHPSVEYELTLNPRRNLDLDRSEPDRRDRIDQELKLGTWMRLGPRSSMLLSLKGLAERDVKREGGTPASDYAIERDEMWVQLEQVGGQALTVQLGRVPVKEERTWWWDDSLDAVRLSWRGDASFVDSGIGRELFRVSTLEDRLDPAEQGVWRWFGHAGHVWRPRHAVELFWLHAKDGSGTTPVGQVITEDEADDSDATLTWYGLRAEGEERATGGMRLRYWADLAWVSGRERLSEFDDDGTGVSNQGDSTQRVSGQALDVGASWTLGSAFSPTISAAYARGSGDDDGSDGVDKSFRQTGLHENKLRFRGVARFRRYGEVFRPELSNLSVWTAGLGARPFADASVDLVWHRYFLAKADGGLPDSRLDRDPQGTSRQLGSELDLILGWRFSERADLALRYGVFKAGRAFGNGQGETARNLEATLNLEF